MHFSLSLSIQKSYFHCFFVHCQDRIKSVETMRHRRRHRSKTVVHVHVRPTEIKSTINYDGNPIANQSAANIPKGTQVSFAFDTQRRRKRTLMLF